MPTEDLLAVRLQLLKRKMAELEGLASTFAPAVHGHEIAEVTGLPTALADKADASTVTALSASLAGKADASTVTALSASLADKADASTVTALSASLAGKADTAALPETIDDRVAALLIAGPNVTLTYNDTANTLTVSATGGSAAAALGAWDYWEESWLANGTAASIDGFTGAAISAGTNNTAIPAAALLGYNPHGVFLRSSTTANAGYRYQTTSLFADYFGAISHKFRARFLWRTAFTGRTVRIGYLDTATSADAVDGAYFEILGDACAAKTASNSVRTTAPTTVTLALNTPYSFEIDVNAAGTEARFRVFAGTSETPILDTTITTNIPNTSARSFGAGIVATEVSTTASDIGILYSIGMGTVPGFQRATGRT